MNDYWNDPPEQPEPPMCKNCQEFMESSDNWVTSKCPVCGQENRKTPQCDPEPPEKDDEPITWDDRMMNFGPKCPHGNEWFSCDACDHASDIAFDAAREKRLR